MIHITFISIYIYICVCVCVCVVLGIRCGAWASAVLAHGLQSMQAPEHVSSIVAECWIGCLLECS